MTNSLPRSASEPGESSPSLTDRIAERVVNARLALEVRPKTKRSSSPRALSVSDSTSVESMATGELHEIQSLKRVFRDLGVSYRRYRSQTGSPIVPGLRDAAYSFRADPSLSSLVAVAAYLDDLDLLS